MLVMDTLMLTAWFINSASRKATVEAMTSLIHVSTPVVGAEGGPGPVAAHDREENQEAHELQRSRRRQQEAPVPLADIGHPTQGDAAGPKCPTCPAPAGGKGHEPAHLRQGVIANAYDEGANPAEDLGVAVGLKPGRGKPGQGMPAADQDQIPGSKEGPRYQQEQRGGDRVDRHQTLYAISAASGLVSVMG